MINKTSRSIRQRTRNAGHQSLLGEDVGMAEGSVPRIPRQTNRQKLEVFNGGRGTGGVFSFFTQSPSFLAYQSAIQEALGESNAQTLFGMKKIPTDNHIRDMLDPVSPK